MFYNDSTVWAMSNAVFFFCHFTHFFLFSLSTKSHVDKFCSFTLAGFLYHVETPRCTVKIALLYLTLYMSEIERVVKHLYTDRRGNFHHVK